MMKNKKNIVIIGVSLLIIILDQLIKWIVKNNMNVGDSIPLINNVLHLTYVQNQGAGFGIMQGQQILFILLSFAVLIAVGYYYKKIPSKTSYLIVTALLIGGTVGNLIDRIFLGFVIDFIDFRIWPVFNLADSCLTIAIILLVIENFKIKNK